MIAFIKALRPRCGSGLWGPLKTPRLRASGTSVDGGTAGTCGRLLETLGQTPAYEGGRSSHCAGKENKNNTKQEIIVGWCLTPPPPNQSPHCLKIYGAAGLS